MTGSAQPLVVPLPTMTVRHFVRWALRRLRRYSVVGDSMVPTLLPDQVVLAEVVETPDDLAIGDVVVTHHPRRPNLLIVKRVIDFDRAGWIHVHSDNVEAQYAEDSRLFGPLPPESVVARVVAAVRKF